MIFHRRLSLFTLLALLLFSGCSRPPSINQASPGRTRWSVYFSPHGGCTDAIVEALGKAHESVLVQAYSFTSAPIAKALAEAKHRGADVRIILDKSNLTERYSPVDFFLHSGIPPLIDSAHAIAHNKVMVLDHRTVITGSFNFTRAAEERNAENLLIIDDANLAARYEKNWELHASHSEKYE